MRQTWALKAFSLKKNLKLRTNSYIQAYYPKTRCLPLTTI
jgi:hypothetical protein